jgi:hypothetical protein
MCGDVRIMLTKPESQGFDHASSILYFRVADIHAAGAELADRVAPFDDEPHLIARIPDHELWMAFFRDPDRNLHGAHGGSQVAAPRTTDSSRPRSSGIVTLESVGSACRAAEYAPSASTWDSTLSATTRPPGSSSGRARPKSAS